MSQITRKNFSEPKKGCKSVKYCLYNGKLKQKKLKFKKKTVFENENVKCGLKIR